MTATSKSILSTLWTAGTLWWAGAACAQPPAPDPVARVGEETISRTALQAAAAPRLLDLDRQRAEVLEETLDRLVEERLLAVEARRRGVDVDTLLQGDGAAGAVSDDEVNAFYEKNRAQIGQPKDAVAGRIRTLLERQRQEARRGELVARLTAATPVERFLEPFRVPVTAASAPALGPAAAPVTLLAFEDFQCPYCARLAPVLPQLAERYGDRLRIAFRHFPLTSIHPRAQRAAEAAVCADRQGAFWRMAEALFADPQRLGDLEATAEDAGLELEPFRSCLESGASAAVVAADVTAGRAAGVTGTPTLFVNGRPVRLLRGRSTEELIAAVIDDELRRAGEAHRIAAAPPALPTTR